jgi:hypothetical protein
VRLFVVLAVLVGSLALAPSAAAAPDPDLGRTACALTGRVYVAGSGCSRTECVRGAHRVKLAFDAELCARSGRGGAPYAQPVSADRCRALGRIWIPQINSCASQADRRVRRVSDAPQCLGRGATYLTHREVEGSYDECVSPRALAKLERLAKRSDRSVNAVALERNRVNCLDRAGFTFTDGLCAPRSGPAPELGGTLVVGDSVGWRAEDELARQVPEWTLDLVPGRRLDELGSRLDHFRADRGEPTRLVVQLGTNRRRGFDETDFRAVMAGVPAAVPVVFLLPYRAPNAHNAGPVNGTKKYAAWMRALAADRPGTCLVDWPAYAAAHDDRLVDGEHPGRSSEGWYARWLVRSVAACG